MKNQISFTTGLFDSGQVGVPSGSGLKPGEDLARWLIKKTSGDEFLFGEPFQNNGGWAERVSAGGEKFELGFELIPASMGSAYADWVIRIGREKRWTMFRAKGTETRGRLCDLIHNVLRDEGEIREVQWGE